MAALLTLTETERHIIIDALEALNPDSAEQADKVEDLIARVLAATPSDLMAALAPFAKAADYTDWLHFGAASPSQVKVWQPQSTEEEIAGISVQDLRTARDAFNAAR